MLNHVVLMGRLTADPEQKQTPNGVSVTSFSVAVDRSYGKEKQTDFIPVAAWRQTAEFICKYFQKGQLIALEGSIQTRSYTDKNGNKRNAFEVIADRVHFCGGKQESGQTQKSGQADDFGDFEGFEEIGTSDDALPF